MIVRLDKYMASTKNIVSNTIYYNENEFIVWPSRREKLKFLGIEYDKSLDFLDMLNLITWENMDALSWKKKQ